MRHAGGWLGRGLLLAVCCGLAGCRPSAEETARGLTGGDAAQGRVAIRKYGCGSCHNIPGVAGATAMVGPPLDRIAERVYLAGRKVNTPENMIEWIRHPQQVEGGTAMPELGLSEEDARHIAAYLYTLRK